MIQIVKLDNLTCRGEINYEEIIHDSVGFVVNNAIDTDIYNTNNDKIPNKINILFPLLFPLLILSSYIP